MMNEGMTVWMMVVEDGPLKGKLPWSYTDLSHTQELFSPHIFLSGVWECGETPGGLSVAGKD
jgi:hypothetical protein